MDNPNTPEIFGTRQQTKQNKNTIQKTKNIDNTDPPRTPGLHQGAPDW